MAHPPGPPQLFCHVAQRDGVLLAVVVAFTITPVDAIDGFTMRSGAVGALRVALSAKLADEQLTIVDEFKLKDHKTKALREILNKFAETGTVLLVDTGGNENLELSSRNLPGVELMANNEVHAYHLLKYKRLLISRPALEKLQEALTP